MHRQWKQGQASWEEGHRYSLFITILWFHVLVAHSSYEGMFGLKFQSISEYIYISEYLTTREGR